MGLKAPRGYGWITNPRKAAYNRIYNRTSRGCLASLVIVILLFTALVCQIALAGGGSQGDLNRARMLAEGPVHRIALESFLIAGSKMIRP
jgi:hypothetical protein